MNMMKSKYVFTQQIKEIAKFRFDTLKIIVVKMAKYGSPGEIWFIAIVYNCRYESRHT